MGPRGGLCAAPLGLYSLTNTPIRKVSNIRMDNHTARYLQWKACFNTRDLGGFPTQDNKQTRWHAFIRSDTLSRLTKHGQEMLTAYGVTTILDLRFPSEAANDPSPFQERKPINDSPQYLHLPLFDGHNIPSVKDLVHRDPVAAIYCGAIELYQQNIARIVREMVQRTPGTILFHCHSGKDRTGILAALLLALAGVSASVIAEDYALSSGYLRPMYQQILTETDHPPEKREKLTRKVKQTLLPETMLIVLSYLETCYGGVASFLKHSGLTQQEIEHLRIQLVE